MVAQYFRHALWSPASRFFRWFATHAPVVIQNSGQCLSHAHRSEAKPRWSPVSKVRRYLSTFLMMRLALATQ
jgi:hypothetical protein